jgi:hypothetical protein
MTRQNLQPRKWKVRSVLLTASRLAIWKIFLLTFRKPFPSTTKWQSLTETRSLPVTALSPLVKALLDQLPDDESSAVPVITVKPESVPSSPASGGNKAAHRKPTYDPAVVYILEFCTVLALRDPDAIELLGKYVAEALQMILRDAGRYHSVLVSRAAYYQFNILKASYVSDLERIANAIANQQGS